MDFAKLLIVDDETDITEFLQYNLEKSNFITEIANDVFKPSSFTNHLSLISFY